MHSVGRLYAEIILVQGSVRAIQQPLPGDAGYFAEARTYEFAGIHKIFATMLRRLHDSPTHILSALSHAGTRDVCPLDAYSRGRILWLRMLLFVYC